MPQICETVTGTTMTALVAARDAVRDADLVELRLDGVARPDIAGALAGRTRPVLVTCRAAWEGGRFDGSEEERAALLRAAVDHGAEYVDVEWRADVRLREVVPSARRVLSHHDLSGTPADLGARARAMAADGAAVVKLAVTAARLSDVAAIRDVAQALRGRRRVLIAMGAAGLVTRLHPALFGSSWTYAGSAAPGQLPAAHLAQTYRVRATSDRTALFGVAGAPIAHSASPALHNAAFAAAGLDAVYVPLECGAVDELLDTAARLGVRGLSITAPLKTACVDRVDEVDALSARVGAVNTLRWTGGRLEGANFDVEGFLAPLDRRGVRLDGAEAVVMGAGGAARAAAIALADRGARVSVSARRPDTARRLADALGVRPAPWPPPVQVDVLVNATPAGTHPRRADSPIDPDRVTAGLVYDLVYNPRVTTLMRAAAARGATTIGGLEMLVAQAARQFTWWTGVTPDDAVLTAAAEAFLDEGRPLSE